MKQNEHFCISIIAPLYNCVAIVEDILHKFSTIKYENKQIIFVDDCSTDGTFEAISSLIVRLPEAMVVQTPTNLGAGGARNFGLRHATGELIWFCDWDDEWHPDILGRLASPFYSDSVDVSICQIHRLIEGSSTLNILEGIDRASTISGSEFTQQVLRTAIHGFLPNKLFRRSLFDGHEFPAMRTHEDLYVLIEMLPRIRQVSYVPGPGYIYVQRAGSLTNSIYDMTPDALKCVDLASRTFENTDQSRLPRYFELATLRSAATVWVSRRDFPMFLGRSRALRSTLSPSDLRTLFGGSLATALQVILISTAPRIYFALHISLVSLRNRFRNSTP